MTRRSAEPYVEDINPHLDVALIGYRGAWVGQVVKSRPQVLLFEPLSEANIAIVVAAASQLYGWKEKPQITRPPKLPTKKKRNLPWQSSTTTKSLQRRA